MNHSDNNVKACIIAKMISDSVGRTYGHEYFRKLIDATCEHLELSCGCIFSIENEFHEEWKLIADSESHKDSCSLIESLEPDIKKEIISNNNFIIDFNESTYTPYYDNSPGLKYLITFILYDSSNNINGAVVFGDIKSSIDHKIMVDVIETHIARTELVLDNIQNIKRMNTYEDNYNKLINSSLDAIWEADASGRITDINPSCKKIYGYPAEDMIGKYYTDFMTDNSANHFVEDLALLSQGESVYNVLSDHITNNHEHIMVCYNITPKYDHNNVVTGITGTTRDISTSIKAQKTIKNTSELFSSILSRLPVIFFRVDKNGYFVEIRGNGLKRMGVKDMDWVGKPGYGLFIGMDTEIDSALSGNTVIFENKGSYDGTPWWFYTSMFFDNWSGDGAVGFSVDITEQKYVEEQLIVLLNDNRKLVQKLVEVQEDERRTLARELHDEFGQSITAIKSLATVITVSGDNQYTAIRSLANSIIDLSGQLYDVVNKIMQRLRPDIIDNLDFSETLNNCIVRSQLETAGVNCYLNVVGNINGLDEVVRVTIYRIVQECLTNISKHAMASNVTIHVEREKENTNLRSINVYDAIQSNGTNLHAINRDTIRIEISDDGVGIDTNQKVQKSKHKKSHGLQGINERVTAMGGTLTVSGEPGKGSKIQAILVLGNKNHDVSHDINKCIADFREKRVGNNGKKTINSH